MGSYGQDDDWDEYEDDFIDDDDGVGVSVGVKKYDDDRADEDEVEDEDEDEDEGEEVEEEPISEEALKLLKYREKLKEQFRSKLRQENGGILGKSLGEARRPTLSNFGSFFGPSQPVIADRVAQESKALLETRHLALKAPKPSTTSQNNGKVNSPSISGPKNGVSRQPLASQVKLKSQIIKQIRDYSFLLSEDADVPKPNRDHGQPKKLVSKPDTRPAQVPAQSTTPSGHPGRKVVNVREQRKPLGSPQVCSTRPAPVRKFTSDNRSSVVSSDPRRQLDSRKHPQPTKQAGYSSGSGPGRPPLVKALPPKTPLLSNDKKIPLEKKMPLEKKTSVASAGYRDRVPSVSKQNVHNGQRLPVDRLRAPGVIRSQERSMSVHQIRDRVLKKENVSSNTQMKQPKQSSIRATLDRDNAIVRKKTNGQLSAHSQSGGVKKDPAMRKRRFDEIDNDVDGDPLDMIRKMFGYDKNRYADDDDDDKSMEVSYKTIRMEEKNSARIAKKEDEEELAKIMEEERQEKLRKKAKMRKLSQR